MKRKILVAFISICIGVPIYWMQKRNFYYLPEINAYATVWKNTRGTCYIIIGEKYLSLFKPSNNVDFIKTTNSDILTIIYNSEEDQKLNIETENKEMVIVNQVNYSMRLFDVFNVKEKKEWENEFYSFELSDNLNIQKAVYNEVVINTRENLVVINGNVVKHGNILGW